MSKPYPSYKDSGVEWLGEVPKHWTVARVKDIAQVVNGYPFDSKQFAVDGKYPLLRIRDLNNSSTEVRYTGDFPESVRVQTGELLIGMDGDFNVGEWRGDEPALLNQRMCCVRAARLENNRLLRYALPAPLKAINDITYSTTVKHLSSYQVEKMKVAVPPDFERRSIVAFLDHETAKIDALVDEQRRLIELLKEKRQAVISHAVTKGLNPNAPMKDSAIEWLGEVPEHWEVFRLGNLYFEANEPGGDDLPVLSVSIHHGVSDKELDENELDRKVSRSEDRTKYKRVSIGDLVYNMMRAWQGGFGTVKVEGMVSPAYVVARPKTSLETAFVEYLLRTPQAIEEMRRRSNGVTDFRLRLYWDEFKNVKIAVPPKNEVQSILDYLTEIEAKNAELVAACQSSISVLQERRTALISAAVTGKIDVRGLAQQPAELEIV